MSEPTRISLEEWQAGLMNGTLGTVLSTNPRETARDPYANANPYLTPERMAYMRQASRTDLAHDGNKIVERIAFWNELPVVGAVVASRLAARLDKISDRIEELA